MASIVGSCNNCGVAAGHADVYYWLVSGVNTDFLSVIGTSSRPVDDGFFTHDNRGHKEFLSRPNPWATDESSTATITSSPSRLRRFHTLIPLSENPIALNESIPINNTALGVIQIVGRLSINLANCHAAPL